MGPENKLIVYSASTYEDSSDTASAYGIFTVKVDTPVENASLLRTKGFLPQSKNKTSLIGLLSALSDITSIKGNVYIDVNVEYSATVWDNLEHWRKNDWVVSTTGNPLRNLDEIKKLWELKKELLAKGVLVRVRYMPSVLSPIDVAHVLKTLKQFEDL